MFKKNNMNSVETKRTEIISDKSPFPFVEAYRSLRTNFNFITMGGKIKTLVVTSALPGEGKSSFSINLATSLAENGMKVLLIDCDMRKPSLHRYLRLRQSNTLGISELISTKSDIHDGIGTVSSYDFDIIMSGPIPPNSVGLLESGRMSEILSEASELYDYVICDAPPVTVVTDAAVLSQKCDGTILVVRQDYADRDQVIKAKHNLINVGANVLGVVLNNYDAKISNSNFGDTSEYYYYGEK